MTWSEDNRAWLERARARWSPRTPESLRLRAWLAAPVAWDGYDPLTLEGPLQYVIIGRETGRMPDDVFRDCPIDAPLEETDVPIPIVDDRSFGPVPIARASAGVFSPGSIASIRWRRTRPRADFYGVDVVKVATAEMKAHNLPAATVVASYLDFFVVGDLALLTELLQELSEIGARRGGGLGQVQGWEVTPQEDWSLWGAQGQLMRSLPASVGDDVRGAELRLCTLRAPYWHPRTRGMGWQPVQRLSSQGAA